MNRSTAGGRASNTCKAPRHQGIKAEQPAASFCQLRQAAVISVIRGIPRMNSLVILGNKSRKGERDTVALVHSCFYPYPHHGFSSTASPCPAPLRSELLNRSNAFNTSQPPNRLQVHAAAAPLLLLALQCLRSPSIQHFQVHEPIPGHKCRTPNRVSEIQQGYALR